MALQELKKHKQERQVAKQSKLATMDPVELQEQVPSVHQAPFNGLYVLTSGLFAAVHEIR